MLRRTLKIGLMAGMLGMSTMSFASVTDLQANVKVAGEKSFALYLKGLSSNVKIVLRDQQGYILYKEQLENQERFAKRFNLMRLPDGEYTLKIEDKSLIKTVDLTISGEKVYIGEENVTFIPRATADQAMVEVEMPSMNDSELNVAIKDSNGELIFEEVVVNKEKSLKRYYDLSKVKNGEYSFIFSTDGHTFVEPVTIRRK